MDVDLVLLMYDALQTVKLELQLQVGLFFDAFQNLLFSLQYFFGSIEATIVSLSLKGTISEILDH